MAESEYREYLINTSRANEVESDILDSMKVDLAQRAALLLTISAMIEGTPVTTHVSYLPTRVEHDERFVSYGVIKGADTEASIKSEADGMYLVMDAAIDHPTDDNGHLTTTS
jgi:hypothetical protein